MVWGQSQLLAWCLHCCRSTSAYCRRHTKQVARAEVGLSAERMLGAAPRLIHNSRASQLVRCWVMLLATYSALNQFMSGPRCGPDLKAAGLSWGSAAGQCLLVAAAYRSRVSSMLGEDR